jgi:3-hydroxybutyryl-CoA dehydrogenase
MTDAIKSTGVIGLGVMGFDIAFLYAQKGYRALVYDAAEAAMKNVPARRDRTIERLQRRNRITEAEAANVRNLLAAAPNLDSLCKTDLITEAVSESGETKRAVYRALRDGGFAGILTTNTSSLTRRSLLGDGDYANERFATTHFFNPVLYTQIVEVVKGDMSKENCTILTAFLADLGRKPVETKDISGFVSNSVLMVYAVMALRLIEAGATIDAVDGAAKDIYALPPCLSYDSWKPSIVEDVTQVMFDFRRDAYLRSSKLLTALAKSNPVFYVDQKPNSAIYMLAERGSRAPSREFIKLALLTSVRTAAARIVELGEAPAMVDFIATVGLKFPREPLAEIDEMGAGAVLKDLRAVNETMPVNGLQAPALLTAMASEGQKFFQTGQANPWLAAHVEGKAHASD